MLASAGDMKSPASCVSPGLAASSCKQGVPLSHGPPQPPEGHYLCFQAHSFPPLTRLSSHQARCCLGGGAKMDSWLAPHTAVELSQRHVVE